MDSIDYKKIREIISDHKEWFIQRLKKYVEAESPTDDIIQNRKLLHAIAEDFKELDYQAEWKESVLSAGQIICSPKNSELLEDQLLIGHADTVWPVGTLD